MWSCVKTCVTLCYFKKAAWREEIEPSFFQKTLPFNGRKGQVSFPHISLGPAGSALTPHVYSSWALLLPYFLGAFQVCNLSCSDFIFIVRCGYRHRLRLNNTYYRSIIILID